jgi:predicted SPOUT superfamily RNA methylase MTH1
MNPVLRLAGLLPPLDMHHHFRRTDADAPYREGVTVEKPYSYQPVFGQTTTDGVFVDVGLGEPIFAKSGSQSQMGTGQRVTVRMTDSRRFGPSEGYSNARN